MDAAGFEVALDIHRIVNELRAELPRLPEKQRFAALQAKLAALPPALATAVTAVYQLGRDLTPNPSDDGALAIWRRKLEFLRVEYAKLADPAQKFTLAEQIREAEIKIRELGG